jgi:hypothetical protein
VLRLLVSAVLTASVLVATSSAAEARPVAGPAVGPVEVRATPRPSEERAGLLARIRSLPGVVSARPEPGDDGVYRIGFRQPADHARPRGATFVQRLVLRHRGTDRPVVLGTQGYAVGYPSSEPGQLLRANELLVEHRFFGTSRPARPRWARQLTIRQAAADVHRVVRSFQRLYRGRWISTGASKGGMTATYHRRFYPRDVDGTIAYVAPNDVVDTDDRYDDFLATVGTVDCRDALIAVQRRVLGEDRAWFVTHLRDVSRERDLTWRTVGGVDTGLEITVIDAYFAFWQYAGRLECWNVPEPDATRRAVLRWFDRVEPLTTYSDQDVRPYVPYYYQAAAELGSPAPWEEPLADLLRHPGTNLAESFVPRGLRPVPRRPGAMRDVDSWVRTQSRRMVFVYGEDDPWSAEPFRCGRRAVVRQCSVHTVRHGTHGSTISDLPRAERRAVVQRLRRWAGLG